MSLTGAPLLDLHDYMFLSAVAMKMRREVPGEGWRVVEEYANAQVSGRMAEFGDERSVRTMVQAHGSGISVPLPSDAAHELFEELLDATRRAAVSASRSRATEAALAAEYWNVQADRAEGLLAAEAQTAIVRTERRNGKGALTAGEQAHLEEIGGSIEAVASAQRVRHSRAHNDVVQRAYGAGLAIADLRGEAPAPQSPNGTRDAVVVAASESKALLRAMEQARADLPPGTLTQWELDRDISTLTAYAGRMLGELIPAEAVEALPGIRSGLPDRAVAAATAVIAADRRAARDRFVESDANPDSLSFREADEALRREGARLLATHLEDAPQQPTAEAGQEVTSFARAYAHQALKRAGAGRETQPLVASRKEIAAMQEPALLAALGGFGLAASADAQRAAHITRKGQDAVRQAVLMGPAPRSDDGLRRDARP